MKNTLLTVGLFTFLSTVSMQSVMAQTGFVSEDQASTATNVVGFSGPGGKAEHSVAHALKARDESYVTLTGTIVESVGNEKYRFKDATGEITVEIDYEDWHGISATPETILVISGEVDREWTSTKIDVERVSLATNH
ncbi:YgiW/YdeI family stress tolerance OB fold protein [Agarivorans aestuarii]|uniref:YgiW/YdeI family stress tolerance OB fold protein n=1 Tax=Agarivorans aestuarii TaxID=1563703 RepID=UPI001C8217E9|nr:NirD/YgiW/YdeI family stress tolerance protein [Agarivorans aestuarii]